MTVRVTATEVKNVINTDVATSILTEHVEVASRFVDDLLGASSLSAGRLRDIELYLAAHFCALYDVSQGMANEREIGTARDRYDYQSTLGPNLGMTRYGQMAMTLDTTGTLLGLDTVKTGGKKALFRTFGTT